MKKNISETAQAFLNEKKESSPTTLPAFSVQIRIPIQRPIAPRNRPIKRETQQVSKEWSEEVSHTDRVSSYLPSSSSPTTDLAPKRIQRFHQKKTSSLLKKMAQLHDAASKKVDQKVSKMNESDVQQKLEKNQDELWRDMIKPHEERHFQIGRITNYFS